jgi:hypothetical protein
MTLVWRPGFAYDIDASNYIDAVEAADQADTPGIGAMETAVRYAINDFVIGCKNDGVWTALKNSCILAGAKTLEGSFIDLKSCTKVLTNNNFADGTYSGSNYTTGDYNRKTGLVGAAGKTLNSNRNNNADPQNSKHVGVYATTITTAINQSYASTTYGSGFTSLNTSSATTASFNINADGGAVSAPNIIGFLGANRSASNIQQARTDKATVQNTRASQAPRNENIILFNGVAVRLAFYSIGESLDLALLDARVTALITAFGVAIP